MVITHRPAAPQSVADPSAGGPAPRLPPPPRPWRCRARPLLRPRPSKRGALPGSAAVTTASCRRPGLPFRSRAAAVVAVRATAADAAIKGSHLSPEPTQIQLCLALKGEAWGGGRRRRRSSSVARSAGRAGHSEGLCRREVRGAGSRLSRLRLPWVSPASAAVLTLLLDSAPSTWTRLGRLHGNSRKLGAPSLGTGLFCLAHGGGCRSRRERLLQTETPTGASPEDSALRLLPTRRGQAPLCQAHRYP